MRDEENENYRYKLSLQALDQGSSLDLSGGGAVLRVANQSEVLDVEFRVVQIARSKAWRVLNICGQAIKGAWGMSWRQKAMTGVEDCEKPGVAVKQALIPGFHN